MFPPNIASVGSKWSLRFRFWLMDCDSPREAARMAQEIYNEAVYVPYMAKFVVFARRTQINEWQLRVFCMTDDKEDKTLERQEHYTEIAKSRDVEVLAARQQYVEFSGNTVPAVKVGEQLNLRFIPFQENRLMFSMKVSGSRYQPKPGWRATWNVTVFLEKGLGSTRRTRHWPHRVCERSQEQARFRHPSASDMHFSHYPTEHDQFQR